MALVKCNHCGKQTKNDTEKCKLCNKNLDKNLEPIENRWSEATKKSAIKKQVIIEKEENYNWICEECKEENEPTYDICWKCSTESVIAKTKYKEFSKKENESIKKDEGKGTDG